MSAVSFAQPGTSEGITWKTSVEEKADGVYQVKFTGDIPSGHYTYTIDDEYSATSVNDLSVSAMKNTPASPFLSAPLSLLFTRD